MLSRLSIATRVDIPEGTLEKAAEIYFQLAENKRNFERGVLKQDGLAQSRVARLAHISEKEARQGLRLVEFLVRRVRSRHTNTVSLSYPPRTWTASIGSRLRSRR